MRWGKSVLTIAVACLAAGLAAPAAAQCRLCATPTTDAEKSATAPIRLEVQSRLDFDRVIFAGLGEGSVELGPDGLTRPGGGIHGTGTRAMPGSVLVRGEPGRAVRVDLPRQVILFGERGGTVRIDPQTTDLPRNPQIGADGTLSFRFGGGLKVNGNPDGVFRGDVDIVVDYL